jgi:hypothetical protein
MPNLFIFALVLIIYVVLSSKCVLTEGFGNLSRSYAIAPDNTARRMLAFATDDTTLGREYTADLSKLNHRFRGGRREGMQSGAPDWATEGMQHDSAEDRMEGMESMHDSAEDRMEGMESMQADAELEGMDVDSAEGFDADE